MKSFSALIVEFCFSFHTELYKPFYIVGLVAVRLKFGVSVFRCQRDTETLPVICIDNSL